MTFVKKGVRYKCIKRYKKEIRSNKWVLNIYLNESVFDVDVIIWMIICFYVISCVRLIYGKPLARSINHSPTFVTVNTHKSTVSICINFYTILFHLPFLFSNDHRYACLVKIRFLLLPLWKKSFFFLHFNNFIINILCSVISPLKKQHFVAIFERMKLNLQQNVYRYKLGVIDGTCMVTSAIQFISMTYQKFFLQTILSKYVVPSNVGANDLGRTFLQTQQQSN